jgi:hypothetical protein
MKKKAKILCNEDKIKLIEEVFVAVDVGLCEFREFQVQIAKEFEGNDI